MTRLMKRFNLSAQLDQDNYCFWQGDRLHVRMLIDPLDRRYEISWVGKSSIKKTRLNERIASMLSIYAI